MTGHLFVVQGNLLRLACDAVVIPCDNNVDVSRAWLELLPPERVSEGHGPWKHVSGCVIEDNQVDLEVGGDRSVFLVVTAERKRVSVEDLVDRVLRAVERAARGLHRHQGRALPLIALPLVGTGEGGLGGKRGLVVNELVPRLMALAQTAAFDVALVLHDRQDFAAVQSARARAVSAGAPDAGWEALSAPLRKEADLLGERAARGELSLFLGSGVSAPVGLPSWEQLLILMAQHPSVTRDWRAEANLLIEAERLKDELGEKYQAFMCATFDVSRHALGHALLADLKVGQMVTTNYDPCLELALDSIHDEDEYCVLTRSLSVGGKPWLLKLHGDIRRPDSLVLTKADYTKLDGDGAALHGVVQSLMLTSHLLFVGFSLRDRDFLELAKNVKIVRAQSDEAQKGGELPRSGTALALHEDALDSSEWADQIKTVPMGADHEVAGAARTLEVFLDRLSWRAMTNDRLAAEFLLDDRYYEGASPADTALREALERFDRDLPAEAKRSAGWNRVDQALTDLGYRRNAERDPDTVTARALAVEIARCPLLGLAAEEPLHPCHDVVAVQPVAMPARQVPEGWAGALLSARIVFLSSNPSISVAPSGAAPLAAEAYPTGAESDEAIAEFVMRRFDPGVEPQPFVLEDRHLQLDGGYSKKKTSFWTSIRARATELLGHPADPNTDYVLTEVVHCKSKGEMGVASASSTCADRYLDRILELAPAGILVVVGIRAHERLADRLNLPEPPYNVRRVVGGRERRVVFLWHPAGFKGPKKFSSLYSDLDVLQAATQGRSAR